MFFLQRVVGTPGLETLHVEVDPVDLLVNLTQNLAVLDVFGLSVLGHTVVHTIVLTPLDVLLSQILLILHQQVIHRRLQSLPLVVILLALWGVHVQFHLVDFVEDHAQEVLAEYLVLGSG